MNSEKPVNSTPSVELPSKAMTASDLRHLMNQVPFFTPIEFRMYDSEYQIDETSIADGVLTITLKPKGVSR